MKYIMVIAGGMADIGLPQLAGKTPLAALALPAFDRCAGCFSGRVLTTPRGTEPGDRTAVMTLLGFSEGQEDTFETLYRRNGTMVSDSEIPLSVATEKGIKTVAVAEGACEALVQSVLDALNAGDDFAVGFMGTPAVASRARDMVAKLQAIQAMEYRVIAPLIAKMTAAREDFRLMIVADHQTLVSTGADTRFPVPYAIYDSRKIKAALEQKKMPPKRKFSEDEMACDPVLMVGTDLIRVLFETI